MVGKSYKMPMPLSEYQRKFKSKNGEALRDYNLRLEYRRDRRNIEQRHTVIEWEFTSDTDSELSSASSVPQKVGYGYRQGKDARLGSEIETDKSKTYVKDKVANGRPYDSKYVNPRNNGSQTHDSDQVENKARPASAPARKEETKKGADSREAKVNEKQSRSKSRILKPKHSDHKPAHTKPRPKTAKYGPRASAAPKKPPLVPYGWAYRGPVDNHRTFNVNASQREVFPSALRASKRRQLEIEKKEAEKYRKSREKLRTEALFNFLPYKDDSWLTEYQRNYCGNRYIPVK